MSDNITTLCECSEDVADHWFDRTVCPEPCGMMHHYCSTCGRRSGRCALDQAQVFEYLPPEMTDGKTWADSEWWSGAGHSPPSAIENFSDAEQLAWARCWAYGEAMGMTTREWHLMWPIVYGALNACSQVASLSGANDGGSRREPLAWGER